MGAMAAAAFGYRGAFFASSLVLFAIFAFCWIGLSDLPPRGHTTAADPLPKHQIWLAWLLALIGTMHIVFLPSVLPNILAGFAVPADVQLVTAGTVVFLYGISAAAGSYGFSRLASTIPPHRLIVCAAFGAAGCQLLLIAPTATPAFTIVRMAQTAFAAGIFPLILAQVAATGRSRTVGLINTARFAGNALGPVAATFILSNASLWTLYCVLAGGLVLTAVGEFIGSRTVAAPPEQTTT
jgi:predicted MFS family arabinose efflux permease